MFSKSFRSFTVAIAAACLMPSCLPAPKYVDLTQKNRIAVVSFTLNESITMEDGDTQDSGPGLFQKVAMVFENESGDGYLQEALNQIWAQFRENIQEALLGIPLVDFDEIVNNEQLLALTAPVRRIILGTDISSDAGMLKPEGLNYVGASDSKILDSICTILGTDLLLLVTNEAQYAKASSSMRAQISNVTIAQTQKSHIILTTTLYIYEKGNGIIATESFKTKSDDKMQITWKSSDAAHYPKLMAQANAKAYKKIKERFLFHKNKLAGQK